jgi:cyclopropane-fatty-acyl-phospholipid synthase
VADLKRRPVAEQTEAANEQHYEVPTDFYLLCLGKHLKYRCARLRGSRVGAAVGTDATPRPAPNSSCLYKDLSPRCGLDAAEAAMLALYCERAQLAEGQRVLELGCGWGSLSLFMAARYPGSTFVSVSNSRTQKEFIDARAAERGIKNLTIVTANMGVEGAEEFDPPQAGSYDRICSVEMFEHMKNYSKLMRRCARWLRPGGALFIHIFVHREWPYHFEVRGEDDFLARYFFTGGTMPSENLLLYFQEGGLGIEQQWRVNGTHYGLTSEDWLKNLDKNTRQALPILEKTYGKAQRVRWLVRWRLFFLSCAELFAYNGGEEWFVAHYLFRKASTSDIK